jgi:hypothetical protein
MAMIEPFVLEAGFSSPWRGQCLKPARRVKPEAWQRMV